MRAARFASIRALSMTASAASPPRPHSYRARSSKIGRLADQTTRRKFEFDAPQWLAPADPIGEIARQGGFLGQHTAQDFPRLVLHRPVPLSRAQTQFALNDLVEIADRDAGHALALKSMQSD